MLGPFASSSLLSDADVAELLCLLGVEFDANAGNECARAGEKRKSDHTGGAVKEDRTTPKNECDAVLYHLLEAAHYARKGVVRAQHGAG